MNKKLTIGLFGFGVVGEGIYDVLNKTSSLNATIKKICIKDPGKKRNGNENLFTTRYEDILLDPAINIVVELINDKEEAYKIVTAALTSGKAVVSANKAMIAEHLDELLALQGIHNVPFLYEAAVCGSIPIIRNLEEYFDNEMLKSISGVINGSTNYILTKLTEDNLSFNEALSFAQQLGFAETDPTLDISGIDAVNKLSILLLHAFGININPAKILRKGITGIHSSDIAFARKKGYKIKLVAQANKLTGRNVNAFLLPQFVEFDNKLFSVHDEFNGVVIESHFADKQFLYGKGAGRYPTATAVLSDIAALGYDYKYEYRKYTGLTGNYLSTDFFIKLYISAEVAVSIDESDFHHIELSGHNNERSWLVGVIHFEKLKAAAWYENDAVSIIAMPDAVVQQADLQESLQLELATFSCKTGKMFFI